MAIVYVAGPLFSVSERDFNARLKSHLSKTPGVSEVRLPQDFCAGIEAGSSERIRQVCVSKLQTSDIVVCILDGADADSGTAVEFGMAVAWGKKVITVRSDFRKGECKGVNLMLAFGANTHVDATASTMTTEDVVRHVCEAVQSIVEGVPH